MIINDHICSYALAKQLYELGVRHDTMFYYTIPEDNNYKNVVYKYDACARWHDEKLPAYTVGELLQLLPASIKSADDKEDAWLTISKIKDKWHISYIVTFDMAPAYLYSENNNQLADVLAKTLCVLIQNNDVKL